MKKATNILRIVWIISILLHAQVVLAWWHIRVLDTACTNASQLPGEAFSKPALAIGDNSTIHITYADLLERKVIYTYNDGRNWHTEIVDPNLGTRHLSIALDSSNNPHISYGNKYAQRDGEWHIETVEDDTAVNNFIALDSNDNPHIFTHTSYSSPHLKYSYKDSSGWQTEILDYDTWSGSVFSVALDIHDNPHVSYFHSAKNDDSLNYAYKDSTGWHRETVEELSDWGYISSPIIALDSSGNPQICYNPYSQQGRFLKYAHKDSTGWHRDVIEVENVDFDSLSMALDTNDNPHICYRSLDENDFPALKYAYKDTTGWHTEVIDNSFQYMWDVKAESIILDSNNKPHVTYHYRRNTFGFAIAGVGLFWDENVLKYAHKIGLKWQRKVVERNGGFAAIMSLGIYGVLPLFMTGGSTFDRTALALDAMGNPQIIFTDGMMVISIYIGYSTTTLKHAY